MPLYPPALIYLLFPLNWSLSFFCLAHLFWAGLGMYFLAYRWTNNRLGAAVAGLGFAFNGFTLNLLMWPSHIATLSWMPWVVLCVERGWRLGGRQLVLAAVVGALQMLAGGPETILFTWLICLGLWLRETWQAWRQRLACGSQSAPPQTLLWRFPTIVVLVAGLAAAQLFPFLDLAAHSQREQGYADTRWSMPGWGWANFLVPMAFGQRWSKGLFFQYEQAWTSSYYLGLAPLLLALIAVWGARNARARFLKVALVLALLLALGDQVLVGRWLRHLIPQLSFMTYPVKYLTVVTFAVPLLSAFAMAQLRSGQDRQNKSRILLLGGVLLALIGIILYCAWRFPFPTDDIHNTLTNGFSRAVVLILTVLVLFCLFPASSESSTDKLNTNPVKPAWEAKLKPLLPLLLLLLVWVDVWTHEPSQNPTVPSFVYTPGLARQKLAMNPQPELTQSRAMLSPEANNKFRQFLVSDFKDNFLVKRIGYFADCNLLDDVPKVDGFLSLYPRECGELGSALYSFTNLPSPQLLDFLSISQLTTPGKFFEWQPRETFLPLATAGQKPIFLGDKDALPALFSRRFDPRIMVLLLPEAKTLVSITNQTQAQVSFEPAPRNQKTKMIGDLQIKAAAPSLIVLSQTYYHWWRAYLDDQPTPLLRANYAFQAVLVPAGTHRLRVAYEDRAFEVGAALSLLLAIGCATAWLRSPRMQKNES
jgi:hypothetical protein